MINENKVRLMTRLALYEKNQLKDDEKAENYFHGDYLSKQFLGHFCVRDHRIYHHFPDIRRIQFRTDDAGYLQHGCDGN
jgi:hypothetical protein